MPSRIMRWHFFSSFLFKGKFQTSPYMGRLNRSSCRSFIKVSSDRQRSGLSFLMKIDILPIFKISMVGSTTEGFGLTFLMKIDILPIFKISMVESTTEGIGLSFLMKIFILPIFKISMIDRLS